MIQKTTAFILKSFDHRETSRIAVMFTRHHGKIAGLFKGIRRDPRKFGSSLERCSLNEIVFYPSRSSLHLVGQCDMLRSHPVLKTDVRRGMAAAYMTELLRAVMPYEQSHTEVFVLVDRFLISLEQGAQVDTAVHLFQIKLLRLTGFRPHIDACLKCGAPMRPGFLFSAQEGGLICRDCRTAAIDTKPVLPSVVAALLYWERSPWSAGLRVRLDRNALACVKDLLNRFLMVHLGRRLRSAAFVP